MMTHHKTTITSLFLVLITVTSVVGQAPPIPAPTPTIWSFLGIPQGCKKIHGVLFNRRGNLPGLEKKPPLKPIAAEEFLQSEWPVLKEAAEVKQAEDLAPQKIKAIKYLTKIGCGCYDKEDKITKALEAAMGDCTEKVRLATVEAIAEAADGECCSACGKVCCCNETVLKKLAELAYERDETGCYLEPSSNVREAAAETLAICCPNEGPVEEVIDSEAEAERGSGAEDIPEGPTPAAESEANRRQPQPFPITKSVPTRNTPTLIRVRSGSSLVGPPMASPAPNSQLAPTQTLVQPPRKAPVLRSVRGKSVNASNSVVKLARDWQAPTAPITAANRFGSVRHIDGKLGMAHVHFGNKRKVPVGTNLNVYKTVNRQQKLVAIVRVLETFEGSANVTKVKGNFHLVSQGDTVKVAKAQPNTKKRSQKVASARPVRIRTVGLPLFGKK